MNITLGSCNMKKIRVFRHEFKQTISRSEMLKLLEPLSNILKIDRNSNGYMVRSLYFDSLNDIDYNEKLMGIQSRKKIRLRIYDPDTDNIKLELKSKNDIHQLKETVIINKKTALELIKGNYSVLLDYDDDTARKIYLILRENCYRPKCIVEYKRIAFISNSTTRITFDFNIVRSNNIDEFFSINPNYFGVSSDNQVVLEVKFDKFLEPYIGKILNNYITISESVSKYVMSREK